jgi:hypothetical protein
VSREDEMKKGAEVIQRHLREPSSDSGRKNVIGVRGAPKTLAGVPRKGAAEMLTLSDQEIESGRLIRLAKVRLWEREGHLTMIPFYSVRRTADFPQVDQGMQACRIGGLFFEEPEHMFPSEHMFANIALAVKAGVTEEGQTPVFSMKLPGGKT